MREERMTGEEQETELYSFGPMGVGICFGRPGFSVPRYENSAKIVLTNRRIRGDPAGHSLFFRDKVRFEVPYNAVVAAEKFSFSVRRVLWIQYRDGEKTKEISIMCSVFNNQHASKAYDVLQNARKTCP
jgi:hypothetical protein